MKPLSKLCLIAASLLMLGHSYAGAVVSEAGVNPKVSSQKTLVVRGL